MDKSALAYNCPNCGAELYFNADKQKMCCKFCFSEYTDKEIKAAKAKNSVARRADRSDDSCVHMDEYVCPNCGAEVIADENTAAGICAYCHSPVVFKGRLTDRVLPDKIVPFAYGKEEAINKLREYIKEKSLLPEDFVNEEQFEKVTGIYYPFWLTRAHAHAYVVAECTKNTIFKRYDYTVCRDGYLSFKDMATLAISNEDKQMIEGILPFPSDALQTFSMTHLSGFVAKKRDIEMSQVSDEVRRRMRNYSIKLFMGTMGGYGKKILQKTEFGILSSKWEYALMPIWLLTCKTPERNYTFAMNGYTGKIYGANPKSEIYPLKDYVTMTITCSTEFDK